MENRFERCATCQRLKKFGLRCIMCVSIAMATLPTGHAHDHEQGREPPPARGVTVAVLSTASSTAGDHVVIYRTRWPLAST